ncbi:serine/threonine-protein kinase [Dactylosporangium sp. NPDC006015]|uniref:serine/threonine-protein kinase n=1 Tax=Dactylosporangium sp. NPDC006015 TaxID=3154576 RepID=UPI0033A1253C
MLGPGDVLGDRYRLDEFVASGGMGQVFRATDKTLNRTVAVKVLLPGLTRDAEFGVRFRAEARIMASVGHKGVVGVYDYGETPEGTMFLVMAFVEGRPLGERITREGALPADETMAIVAQAADALHAAHSNGIIHRDVKPNNLLVGHNGAVTLVDFGVARSADVTSVTKVNAVIGTALYMSPEQASGKPISPATDIYALGAVAYHCLTGAPPFTGNSPLEIAIKHLQDDPAPLPETVPAGVRAVVERAMAKDPEDRFPTAAALAAAARDAQVATLQDQDLAFVPAAATRRSATMASPRTAANGRPGSSGAKPDRPAWIPVAIGLALLVMAGGVVLAAIALSQGDKKGDAPSGVPGMSQSAVVTTSGPAPGGGGATRTSAAPPTSAPASASPTPATSSAAPPPATSEPPPPPATTTQPQPTTGGTTPPVDGSVPPA